MQPNRAHGLRVCEQLDQLQSAAARGEGVARIIVGEHQQLLGRVRGDGKIRRDAGDVADYRRIGAG